MTQTIDRPTVARVATLRAFLRQPDAVVAA